MNEGKILAYITIDSIGAWSIGISTLLTVLLGARCTWDIIVAMEDPEIGLKEAIKKVKKRIFSVIIALLTTSFVTYFQTFFTG